jgi:hypothetical protein
VTDRPPLPDDVASFVDGLAAGLTDVLGRALGSLFVYGAVAFPRPERWRFDVDFHVLVAHPLRAAECAAIAAFYERLARVSPLGRELDGYVVTLDDALRATPPVHQLDAAVRDDAWALHRAHVLAGRYFLIRGVDPRSIVPVPSWPELEAGLHNELHFIETHPHQTAFGVLNGCRIVYSVHHRDVVVSKYAAAQWGLDNLDQEMRPGIEAALRAYSDASNPGDDMILQRTWLPIVEDARRRLAC